MKLQKIMTAFLISLTVFAFGGRAFADIIMEPSYNNKFYEVFSDECELEYRVRKYTVVTECDVMMSPISSQTVRTAHEGSVMYMNGFYTDEDGVRWGYDYAYSYGDKTDEKSGWVKMENVQVVYDHISFIEEHEAEVTGYNGQLDDFIPQDHVYIWTYPGSGKVISMCAPQHWFPEDYAFTIQNTAEHTYIDPEGHEWVYLGYGFEGWVYLDDPESDLGTGIGIDELNQTTFITDEDTEVSDTDISETYVSMAALVGQNGEETSDGVTVPEPAAPVPQREGTNFVLPVVLAAAAAVAAGIVIFISRKKK